MSFNNSEERVIEILLKCEKLSGLSIEISITFWGYFETGTELDISSNSLSEHEEKKAIKKTDRYKHFFIILII